MGSLRFSSGEKVQKSSSLWRRKSRKEAGEEENEILFWLVDHRLGLGLNVFKVAPVPSQLLTDFGEFKTPSGKKNVSQ